MKLQEAIKTDNFRNEQHKATLNLIYTAYWLRTHLSAVFKEHGITEEQFNVLRILKGQYPQPMCVRDIASRMLEKNSNVPRIIDRLVLKKLVKRTISKEDKRETLVSLTGKGTENLALASKAMNERMDEILSLTKTEAQQLHGILEKLRKVD